MEQIIEKTILGVPHFVVVLADSIHGVCDPEEMLQEPEGNLLIHRVVLCQNKRDLQHVLAIEGHPRRAVRLVKVATGGKGCTAIEYANVVQPEESTGEYVISLGVLAIDPPIEVLHQALKRPFQEAQIRSAQFFFDVEKKNVAQACTGGFTSLKFHS